MIDRLKECVRFSLSSLLLLCCVAAVVFLGVQHWHNRVRLIPFASKSQNYATHAMLLRGMEHYELRISRRDLFVRSKWAPANGRPPVGALEAMQAAGKAIVFFEEIDVKDLQLQLDSATLIQFEPQVWYWVVNFTQAKFDDSEGFKADFIVAVLMDGSCVLPERSLSTLNKGIGPLLDAF